MLGFLIARIEGASLGEVLKQRVFDPLGMRDTSFWVPLEKRDRCSGAYGFNESGKLTKRATWGGVVVADRPVGMKYESGGQGLWSTVEDYLKFARVFVERGVEGGPVDVGRMMTNRLTEEQRAVSSWLGRKPFANGQGFGLGLAVVLERDESDLSRRGSIGSVSWPGAYGGWWQADPVKKTVAIFLAHNMVGPEEMARGVGFGVWIAVEEFTRRALTHSPQ